MKFHLLVIILIASLARAEDIPVEKTTKIQSQAIEVQEDVQTYPEKVSVSQPRLSLDINHNLQRLPGAQVTQFSGPGSQSAIIAPVATGSGGTQLTVDGMPIISAFGRVPDLTYFPPSFFERFDWYSPFYPWSEGRTSPGGRLDMITRSSEKAQTSGSVLYGTANTVQVATSHQEKDWMVGLTGFRTDGNYNYVDGHDQSQQTRTNNDNRHLGLLIKKDWHLSDKSDLSFLAVSQLGQRTDPGSVVYGGGGNGHDTFFAQVGAQLKQQDAFMADTESLWTLSHSVDRNYYSNFTIYTPAPVNGQFGGENSQGNFFSYRVRGSKKRQSFSAQVDGLYERLEAYYPLQKDRQTFGVTLSYDALKLGQKDFLVPRARVEGVSTFISQPQVDGNLSYVHEFEPGREFFAGVASLHKVPSMIALYGYYEGGLPIVGSSSLPIERLEIYSTGYNLVEKTYGLWINAWYSHHAGMALRTSSAGQGLFTQVNDAQTYGISSQLTCQFWERWNAHVSGTVEKTRNNDRGTELTFKPTYLVSAALDYDFGRGTVVTIEDVYEGTRYFSASNVSSFPNGSSEPINWTHLKGSFAVGPGKVYLKVSNLFDSAGWDNPGYPYPGRSYWVGYSL